MLNMLSIMHFLSKICSSYSKSKLKVFMRNNKTNIDVDTLNKLVRAFHLKPMAKNGSQF